MLLFINKIGKEYGSTETKMDKKKIQSIIKNIFLIVFLLTTDAGRAHSSQIEEKPRFRVPRLEIRLPVSQAYEIPAHINDFRVGKGQEWQRTTAQPWSIIHLITHRLPLCL